MAKLVEVIVTVRPRLRFGMFPLDMLRYDGLSPNDESDSGKIERSLTRCTMTREARRLGGETEGHEPIELRRWAERSWAPNARRWESFNWTVVEVRGTGRTL